MRRETAVFLFPVFLFFAFSGCSSGIFASSSIPERPQRYSEVFPAYRNSIEIEKVVVDKEEFSPLAAAPKKLQRIRLVPLVPNSSNFRLPQYRLFDIQQEGPYRVLGLRNQDVLLAVQDLILYEPSSFPRFVAALRGEDETSFLIVRGERVLELQVQFQ